MLYTCQAAQASGALQNVFHKASEELDEDLAPVGSVSHCSMTGSGPQRAGPKRLEAGLTGGRVEGTPRDDDCSAARTERPVRFWELAGDERVDATQGRVESSHLGRPRIMMAQGCAIRYVRIAARLLDGGRHFHGRLAISGALSSANPRANGYGWIVQCYVA